MSASLPEARAALPAGAAEPRSRTFGVRWIGSRTPIAIVALACALAFVPRLGLPAFYDSLLYLILHWIVLATSWNILSGYAGYFSFGHGAFFGAGLYTTSTLLSRWNWPFLWTLPVAAAVACVLGVALGAIVFRVKGIRGEVYALLTLAVTFVIGTIIVNTPIDGGNGVSLAAVPVPAIGPTPSSTFYLLALAAATLTMLVAWAVAVSKLGVGLFAIHDDEDAAEVMGVPTYRYKLIALAISCALAGVAGGIHALFLNYVTVGEVFTITVPLTVVLMSVLGGTRHWAGPAVGAVAITLLLYSFTAANYAVAGKAMVGVILIAAILFMPDGILPRLQRLFARRRAPLPPSAAALAPLPVRSVSVAVGEVLLSARGLAKSFRGVKALAGVDVQVRRGEILGLLGPNGSGKSTFINVVSGHYLSTGGSIVFEGQDLTGRAAHRIARAGISRTYQIPRPFGHQTVLDNVALATLFGGGVASPAVARREAMTWLAFTGLQDKAHAHPADLNLHQRKFLELARALASRPRLVLLDEVLCGLTPSEIDDAVALVRRIRDQGSTVVFVEHVMRAVMALTDRVVVFDHGELLAEGLAAEVMQRPEVMTAYLGPAQAAALEQPEPAAAPQRPTMLEVRELQVAYGQAPALWGVSFELREGELLCVVGPNGAGKTTLINALAGVQRARGGRIVLEGRDLTALPPHRFCEAGVAIVPEGRRLFGSMSVLENLEIGSALPAAKARRADSLEMVLALFPALKPKLAQAAGELSGGQQQMVAIGRALMARPRLLLLDEPSLGLSPLIVNDMFGAIRRINQEGTAVLLVEQNVSMALRVADRAYVLEQGRMVAEGTPDALMQRDEIRRAYLGL